MARKISDKERLDFLQENPWGLEDCVDTDSETIVFCFTEIGKQAEWRTSVRAAIDAAIRQGAKRKGKR